MAPVLLDSGNKGVTTTIIREIGIIASYNQFSKLRTVQDRQLLMKGVGTFAGFSTMQDYVSSRASPISQRPAIFCLILNTGYNPS